MKPSSRKRLPSAELEAAQLIFIVPNEDEWRPNHFKLISHFTRRPSNVDAEPAVVAPDAHRRQAMREPFATPEALHRITLRDEARIHPDARVVDEGPAIEFAKIDAHASPRCHDLRRFAKVERNIEVLREMIERAERYHAERCTGLRDD